jgi:hypothetical protein
VKKYSHFSQDQKITASVVSNINPNAYCLDLQRTSKSQVTRIKKKGLSPTSLFNAKY